MDKKTIKYIQNILRLGTVSWHNRNEALRRARKKVQEGFFLNGRPKYKFYYKCAKCGDWERDITRVEVDHKKEVGEFSGNWNKFIQRLYCPVEDLQVLCIECHREKTSLYNKLLKKGKKQREKVYPASPEVL